MPPVKIWSGDHQNSASLLSSIKSKAPPFDPYYDKFIASPLPSSMFGSIYHLLVAVVSLNSNFHPMSPLLWSIYHHVGAVMPSYTLSWSIQSLTRALFECLMPRHWLKCHYLNTQSFTRYRHKYQDTSRRLTGFFTLMSHWRWEGVFIMLKEWFLKLCALNGWCYWTHRRWRWMCVLGGLW